jgi:hypothetical protein
VVSEGILAPPDPIDARDVTVLEVGGVIAQFTVVPVSMCVIAVPATSTRKQLFRNIRYAVAEMSSGHDRETVPVAGVVKTLAGIPAAVSPVNVFSVIAYVVVTVPLSSE